MNVEEMYQQIILDHYREKHHSGLREDYNAEVTQVNPSCGDELLLRVHLDGDYRGFQEMMRSRGTIELDADTYEDAIAFEGVAKLLARVKCAMLGWSALEDGLLKATEKAPATADAIAEKNETKEEG